jgi:hypothetical protein
LIASRAPLGSSAKSTVFRGGPEAPLGAGEEGRLERQPLLEKEAIGDL